MHALALSLISALIGLLAAVSSPAQAQAQQEKSGVQPTEAAARGPCSRTVFERASYIVCEIDLERHVLRTYWKRPNGKPYGTLWGLVRAIKAGGRRPLIAMNAGMFKEDRSPLGLYVEEGRELVGPDTGEGTGNFYMKPNGVFHVAGNRAAVMETGRFLKERPKADFATQSGPMLVIDGAVHPKISARGVSRYVRNGVGVRDPHTVVFAISRRRVTFGELARLFKDRLVCPNALYLDGQVSGIYTAGLLPKRYVVPLGPMFGAYARQP
jgi:uncharacterized protein YigE (DUF2233 family)